MKSLGFKSLTKVPALPTPSSALEGVILELSTDAHPYYCDGASWIDLTLTGSGSGASIAQVTLDFGSACVGVKAFSFAAAGATTASKIVMTAAPDSDEYEMDGLVCSAFCAVNGTITAFVQAVPGPVSGTRKFNYLLG